MIDIDTKQLVSDAITKSQEALRLNDLPTAKVILEQLVRCIPDDPRVYALLGLAYHNGSEYKKARPNFEKAIKLDPDYPDTYNNLALTVSCLGEIDLSISYLNKSLELSPHNAKFKSNLGLQYRHKGDYKKSLEIMHDSVADDPNDPQLYSNLGGVYGEMLDLDNALVSFKKALDCDPDMANAHVDLAYTYHLQGRYDLAWKEYEYRFGCFPQLVFFNQKYDIEKRWKSPGLDLNNKTLVLYCEQGYGDTINFIRYIPEIKKRYDCRIILHCQDLLESLFKENKIEVDEYFTKPVVFATKEEIPEHDYNASLSSLPFLLEDHYPSGEPYLDTNLRFDLGNSDCFKIGISWAGSAQHPNDRVRSCYLKQFEPIHNIPRVKLYSLQKELRPRYYRFRSETVDFTEGAEHIKMIGMQEVMNDFLDTAAILKSLDLLVTVDTATMHLAGAMGVPTLGMIHYSPDWRWKIEGESTDWYKSIKLFRQKERHNWDTVIQEMARWIKNLPQYTA